MEYEIQTLRKYLVSAADMASTLEQAELDGEKLIRILEIPEVEAEVPAE